MPKSQPASVEAPIAGLRARRWRRFLRGPDPALLEELYEPALARAIRYDRCCSYFSSSVLAAAARGFGGLIQRLLDMGDTAPRPAVRLIVNEELSEDDVRAMVETSDLSALEMLLRKRLKKPKELLERQRLSMLAWMVQEELLEVRVGVMRHGEGIVHAKFGVITDDQADALVFSGSGNESARGLVANYERLEVSASWEDEERHREYVEEFDKLWQDAHEDVHTVSLPEALRLKLVKFAPKEPPIIEPSFGVARQKAAMLWRFIVEAPFLRSGAAACDATAPVDPWPHQRKVVEETANAWPDGRLLCDEVGLGKTIEAALVLRRLMAGRGVGRVLVLLPAGLVRQWQAELREKGGLVFPRLEGTTTLIWPDGKSERVDSLAAALENDLLLMSRETARTENNLAFLLGARPWDLVVLDEAHAARRREQEEGEFNSATLLLSLLRQLQLRKKARAFLFLSATPMQTHPWEPWDLLAVLGEGGAWLADFATVRAFYQGIAAVESGRCTQDVARKAAIPVALDPAFPAPPGNGVDLRDTDQVARKLAFAPPSRRGDVARWLRRGSPLARRMHRNTRRTLKRYFDAGLLSDRPPTRLVEDKRFDFDDVAERNVYDAVTRYIEERYKALEDEKPGKGFVMTIYRRRASSSPLALERSLMRRAGDLRRVAGHQAYDEFVRDEEENLDSRDLDDLGEVEGVGRVSKALPTDPQVARAELRELESLLEQLRGLGGRDTKLEQFFGQLRRLSDDGRPVLVFTEYTDTLEYLRDSLGPHYGAQLACYSGEGGQVYNGSDWKWVSKDRITAALAEGELRFVLCTDAASEGLNLQAAGALVNYDLPWNPGKVEQRIGRIDRIGQRFNEVRVVNLFLKDSVDDRVYAVLRARCGLFEHFVGPMQPVLARARRMLLGRDDPSTGVLETAAREVEEEPLATESYVESEPESLDPSDAPVTRANLLEELSRLKGDVGPGAKRGRDGLWKITGVKGLGGRWAADVAGLEADPSALPLSPLTPELRKLADALGRPGERLPLVVAAHRSGAFRATAAYWVAGGEVHQVKTLAGLRRRLEAWTGEYPDPREWRDTEDLARRRAEKAVRAMDRRARERVAANLRRQTEAARLRLQRELGRYLVCLDAGSADLNAVLYRRMSRDISSATRLHKALERLGGYPQWSAEIRRELLEFCDGLTENRRRARLLGSQIDAALADPRWMVDG